MSRIVLLDSTPLGLLSHPVRRDPIADWAKALTTGGALLGIPEIADYEVRRELLRAGKADGLLRLDGLKARHYYLPLNTASMLLAAELWADARRKAQPGAARQRLDADVILAAQATLLRADGHEVIVATNNVKHLAPYVDARVWQDIPN